ncbi:hypothetical protein CQ018_12325 [Arthrobacter sp. MYb227]|uniref:hypothetical protein n=1 Tax=Arthrobacter sp. MYb227 TaxID=1848601 RepID=UPI000CFB126E|nr:hypothetical protein [Arthrobacter sp. MYb227]PQZ92389.1 hypothetical protein CQ018_12325 [Arthrobacter sp. MYb227]
MIASEKGIVPVWALSTEVTTVSSVLDNEGMSADRLAELRTVLATLAGSPIATLEAHPILTKSERSNGILLHASSPLAKQLTFLVSQTGKVTPQTMNVGNSGEVLYRMVVPAKVAAQMSQGLIKPMTSKAVAGGIYSALRNSTGIAAKATFVPVTGSAAAGAASGTAVTAGATIAGASALTVAAPLVLMAVAVSISAHAEHQRQQAIERITDLLEQLHEDKLDDERSLLDGCRDAIEKATSVLLDQGKIGLSLGLDSSSFAISSAIERTKRRLGKWQTAIAALPEGPVEIAVLTKSFPGIEAEGGVFRAHLELAKLAIALKRRVLVLQAVDHAQLDDETNLFTSFIGSLREDDRKIDELEAGINSVLLRLSTLELKRNGGFRNILFTPGEVDELLRVSYRLRALGDHIEFPAQQSDIAIEIERDNDGSLTVFPAVSA